jgi:hypothetical protein
VPRRAGPPEGFLFVRQYVDHSEPGRVAFTARLASALAMSCSRLEVASCVAVTCVAVSLRKRCPALRGVFGDPYVRVVTLVRRSKKRRCMLSML